MLPALAAPGRSEFLGVERDFSLDRCRRAARRDHAIGAYPHLMQRVDAKQLDALFAPEPRRRRTRRGDRPALPGGEAIAAEIKIDDFAKLDLRIARIVDCEKVEGSTSCCA